MTDKRIFGKIFITAILFILISVCFFVPQRVGQTVAAADKDRTCVLGNVDVVADVGEDKVVHIKETIEVGFISEGQTEFLRRIKVKDTSSRAFGGVLEKQKDYIAFVSEMSAEVNGEPAEVSSYIHGNYLNVSVKNPGGSAFLKEHGSVKDLYTVGIEYDYDMSGDTVKGYDDLIFGFFNEETFYSYKQRQRLSLTLNMPKAFDASQLIFRDRNSSDERRLDTEKGEKYVVSGNSVELVVYATGFKYLTVQIILPESYFSVNPKYFTDYWVFFAITCAMIVFTCIVAFKYRKRRPVVAVEFYPPDVNLLHYSSYWHGRARRKDVCAVIFQWAQAGCVRIIRDGKKDVILEKLRNLPKDRCEEEKEYFDALFSKGDRYSSKEIRKVSNFAQACRIHSAVSGLVASAETPQLFVPGVRRARITVLVASIAASLVSVVYFILIYPNIAYWALFGFTSVIVLFSAVPLYKQFSELRELKESSRLFYRFGAYVLLSFAGAFMLLYWFMLKGVYSSAYDYAGLIYINIAWIVVCALIMPRIIGERSEESQSLYGRMLGFRRFILSAELPRMEALAEENASYFYDILPYCMIMGISDKLDKRMEVMQLAAPDWSEGFSPANIAGSLFASAKSALKGRRGKKRKKP